MSNNFIESVSENQRYWWGILGKLPKLSIIIKSQNVSVPGSTIVVPKASKKYLYKRRVSLAEFRRLRKQFVDLSSKLTATKKSIGNQTEKALADEFVNYLNKLI